MKKTILRSLIVGLFAVVSLNASAEVNFDYIMYQINCQGWEGGKLGAFVLSYHWMEANSYEGFTVDAFPYDNNDHTGEEVRVVWGPSFYQNGFYEGDQVFVGGYDETVTEIWLGTNAIYQTIVKVDAEGQFGVMISAGPTAGARNFGGGPIFYWPQKFEDDNNGGRGEPDWNVVWGWSTWTMPGWWAITLP